MGSGLERSVAASRCHFLGSDRQVPAGGQTASASTRRTVRAPKPESDKNGRWLSSDRDRCPGQPASPLRTGFLHFAPNQSPGLAAHFRRRQRTDRSHLGIRRRTGSARNQTAERGLAAATHRPDGFHSDHRRLLFVHPDVRDFLVAFPGVAREGTSESFPRPARACSCDALRGRTLGEARAWRSDSGWFREHAFFQRRAGTEFFSPIKSHLSTGAGVAPS